MAYQFPKNPYDGQSAEVAQPNGTVFVYTYNEAQNTWELAGQGVDLDQNNIVIYTDNVLARGTRPVANERNTNYQDNRTDSAFQAINNQQDINWVLHDAINLVEGATKVWVDDTAPPDETYQFWWHTGTLELLFRYNEQWWPVSIPPDQVEILRQEIDALYQDTATNKLNIAITQQELDTKVLETKERIDGVEETANDAKTAIENAAFVNRANTFASNTTNVFKGNLQSDKQLTILAPAETNVNPTFIVRGTDRDDNKNSIVLQAIETGERLRVTYKGPINNNNEITNKTYVDNAVNKVNKALRAPTGLRYRFSNNTDATAPPDGYMKRDSNNRWRFSFKSFDGVDIGRSAISDTGELAWGHTMTIWYEEEDYVGWRMKAHYKLDKFRWNYDKEGAHFEFHQSARTTSSLTNGSVYVVTIGGWF